MILGWKKPCAKKRQNKAQDLWQGKESRNNIEEFQKGSVGGGVNLGPESNAHGPDQACLSIDVPQTNPNIITCRRCEGKIIERVADNQPIGKNQVLKIYNESSKNISEEIKKQRQGSHKRSIGVRTQ